MVNIRGLSYLTLNNLSRYKIFSDGSVLDKKTGKFVSQYINEDGYKKCTLRMDDQKRKTFFVHRLVANTFLDNPENFLEINHKDGNKTNNNLDNLEWCTHSQNIKHAWYTGLIKNTKQRMDKIRNQKKRMGKDNHKSKSVILVNTGETFESGAIAARIYRVRQEQLNRCCNPNHPAKSAGIHPVTKEKLVWKFYDKENIE